MSDSPSDAGVLGDRLRLGTGFSESERPGIIGRLVSTSATTSLQDALTEVRDDMVRQIEDATTRQEPRNNRSLRQTP